MSYVFDTSAFIILKNYYPQRFPSVWQGLEGLAADGRLRSVREVLQELEAYNDEDFIKNWAGQHPGLFPTPRKAELEFVAGIFAVPHFQALISQKSLLKGTPVADPFVIAAAAVEGRIVVTQEIEKPNASKIPNVCKHFGIGCFNLESFMEAEGWAF